MRKDYRKKRIVIDTNLCISLLIGKRVGTLLKIFEQPQYELAISENLINEILQVTERPKFARYFTAFDVSAFVQFLQNNALSFKVDDFPQRCRDPKDDFLLELALVSDADILLSGDTDLTDMKQIGHCRIMTASEFMKFTSHELDIN